MNMYKRITYFWLRLRLEIDTIVYLDDAFQISDRLAKCVYHILMKNINSNIFCITLEIYLNIDSFSSYEKYDDQVED